MDNIKFQKSVLVIALGVSMLLGVSLHGTAQEYNAIPIGVPSLQITPDARAGGMGDTGAATTADAYSQYWNASKYIFSDSKAGLAMSYTPWLSKLVSDISSVYVGGYGKFGHEGENAIGASLRYFSMGDIAWANADGEFWNNVSPYEMSLDVSYSRKLSDTFAAGVALRYIRSDISGSIEEELTTGNTVAADISGYNRSSVYFGQTEALLGLGFNISNIGGKIAAGSNDNYRMFLPANMRLGSSLSYPLNRNNVLSVSVDLNKLLVPTPQLPGDNETPDEAQKRIDSYNSTSSIAGIFKSFGDAPGGFKEEMQEVMWSLGLEYTYAERFSLRTGYFHESEYKGNRKHFTVGAGFRHSAFQIDASYLIASAQSNPLDQTLRLSLAFDLHGLQNLFK